MDGDVMVGYVQQKIFFICNLLLRHSGTMVCRVTGPRQHSTDLVQSGLKVHASMSFMLRKNVLIIRSSTKLKH